MASIVRVNHHRGGGGMRYRDDWYILQPSSMMHGCNNYHIDMNMNLSMNLEMGAADDVESGDEAYVLAMQRTPTNHDVG